MAFALLTGNVPFRRQESMATLFAHLNDPVPPLSRYRGDLPSATDAVLARGLAKEPQDRYGRCGEFAAALRDSLTGASHSAPAAQTRLESAPRASRPPHVPETAMWSGTASDAAPATETFTSSASSPAPSGAAPSPVWPSPPGAMPHAARAPAASPRTWAAQPPAVGGRPITRPAPPPPAAGQGGKLPVVSRSAVVAALAAAAVLALLIVLHALGLEG